MPCPTENNIVGTRHCRVLILANNSDATGNDITKQLQVHIAEIKFHQLST